MDAFLHMGGYGAYVWPAFAITLVVLIGLLVTSLRRTRINEERLRALQEAPEERTRIDETEA